MNSKIGVNILLSHVKDRARLVSRLQLLKPTVIVATVDGDNDMKHIHELRGQLPETMVIGRVYMPNDGAFHTKPTDDRYWLASPEDCLNRWGELGKNGGVLYLLNEPGTYQKDEIIDRLVRWQCEVLEMAHSHGIRVCIGNYGVGHPGVTKFGEWDHRFDLLLKALAKYPEMILGTHEYLPTKGEDRIGRIEAMFDRCDTLEISKPKVVITEVGYDTDGGAVNGYKSRGISGDQFAREMLATWNVVYSKFPQIIGATVFCVGDNGQWSAFDVETDQPFWDTLKAYPPVISDPPPIVIPPIVVTPPPPVADYLPPRTYQPAVAHLKNGAGMVNLRSEKSTAPGTDIGDIRAGDKVKYAPQEGDWWPIIHVLPNGKETAGFAHNDYFEPVPRQSESPPPENPTPLPIPDPPQQVLVTPHVHIVVTLPAGIDPQLEAAMKNNVTIEFRKTA